MSEDNHTENKRKRDDGEDTLASKITKNDANDVVITARQNDSFLYVTKKKLAMFPESFLALTFNLSDSSLRANDYVVEVQDRNEEYFPLIQKVYDDGKIELETTVNKDSFLIEFEFWFPGSSHDLVTYSDEVTEMRWLSTVGVRNELRAWVNRKMPHFKASACMGYFNSKTNLTAYGESPNYRYLFSNQNLFKEQMANMGYKVTELESNSCNVSWEDDRSLPLHKKALAYCMERMPTWDSMRDAAKKEAAKGKFTYSPQVVEHHIFRSVTIQEEFQNSLPKNMKAIFTYGATVSWEESQKAQEV